MSVNNDPVPIFEQIPVKEGTVSRMRTFKASALPMAQADTFLEETQALAEQLESGLSAGPKRRELLEQVLEAVCDYDPAWNEQAIREHVTPRQIVAAFLKLRDLNDPLVELKERRSSEEERGARMLALCEKFPHLMQQVNEKMKAQGGTSEAS